MKTAARKALSEGFSLVESVLATLIVSVLIVSALHAAGTVARTRLVQRDRSIGTALAQDLLAEIQQRRYADPEGTTGLGADPGETRATYDDVDDFDALNESPPRSARGAVIAGTTGWRRSCAVVYVDPTNPQAISGSDLGLKRITIKVVSPSGAERTLVALRSSTGASENPVATEQTFIARSSISLQIGTDANSAVSSSVVPLNQLP